VLAAAFHGHLDGGLPRGFAVAGRAVRRGFVRRPLTRLMACRSHLSTAGERPPLVGTQALAPLADGIHSNTQVADHRLGSLGLISGRRSRKASR